MAMQGQFEIGILGKDTAGLAAALHLASAGRKVALFAGPDRRTESPLCDWSPFDLAGLPGFSKAELAKAGAVALSEIRYHGGSNDATVVQKLGKQPAWGFAPGSPAGRLEQRARKTGVKFFKMAGAADFSVADDAVVVGLSKPVRVACLIVTSGLPTDYADRLAIAGGQTHEGCKSIAGVDMDAGSPAAVKKLAGALHVIQMADPSRLGIMFSAGRVVHLRAIVDSQQAGQAEELLAGMIDMLKSRQVLPPRAAAGKVAPHVWYPPAGQAIEIETHHNKRCLLAGTAGGFADCVSGQTLLPSIHSAIIAADIAAKATAGQQLQETLVQFNSAWRQQLADRIRVPSTSLQMLMPLLFVNAKVRARVSDMILTGRQI